MDSSFAAPFQGAPFFAHRAPARIPALGGGVRSSWLA